MSFINNNKNDEKKKKNNNNNNNNDLVSTAATTTTTTTTTSTTTTTTMTAIIPTAEEKQQQQQQGENNNNKKDDDVVETSKEEEQEKQEQQQLQQKGGQQQQQQEEPKIDSVRVVASTKWLSLKTLHWTDQDGKHRAWDMATRTTKDRYDIADAVVIIPILKDSSSDPNTSILDTLLVEQYRPPIRQYTIEFPAGLIDHHKNETPQQAALRELKEETGYIGEEDNIIAVLPPSTKTTSSSSTSSRQEQPTTATTTPTRSPDSAAATAAKVKGDSVDTAAAAAPGASGASSSVFVSRPVCMSPGLCDETVHVVIVEVDLSKPCNQNNNRKQQLDDGEHCIVHRVKLKDGLKQMLDQQYQPYQQDDDDDNDGKQQQQRPRTTTPMPIMGLYLFAIGWELGASAGWTSGWTEAEDAAASQFE